MRTLTKFLQVKALSVPCPKCNHLTDVHWICTCMAFGGDHWECKKAGCKCILKKKDLKQLQEEAKSK